MREDWLASAIRLCYMDADFYSGARKIIRNQTITFDEIEDDLSLADCGYTKSKLTMLIKNYVHQESIDVAINLWERRKNQKKYGSVGFTCYNHFIKSEKTSKRGSVMGPCIQSVTLTWLNDKTTAVDVFYRTTEYFKKFPADLVFLRDTLLSQFDFEECPISEINFHFANITCHPMYFVTMIPLLDNPIKTLNEIKKRDRYFYNWIVKWTARYICPEYHRGIQKFSQAMRVHKDATERIDSKFMKKLEEYLRKNHPGYRNNYTPPEED